MSRPAIIRVFHTAKTKEELVAFQLHNNAAYGINFDYSNPVKEGKNKYTIWYGVDVADQNTMLIVRNITKELSNGR